MKKKVNPRVIHWLKEHKQTIIEIEILQSWGYNGLFNFTDRCCCPFQSLGNKERPEGYTCSRDVLRCYPVKLAKLVLEKAFSAGTEEAKNIIKEHWPHRSDTLGAPGIYRCCACNGIERLCSWNGKISDLYPVARGPCRNCTPDLL